MAGITILGINMLQVKEEKIKNCEIRKRFENIPTISLIIAKKQLKWAGKIVRMEAKQIPPKILTCFLRNPRSSGRRFRTTRDGLFENLKRILPDLDSSGNVKKWRRLATHTKFWDKCLDAVTNGDEIPIFNENEWQESQSNRRNNNDTNTGQEQRNEERSNNDSENTAGSNGNNGQYRTRENTRPQNQNTNNDRQNSPDSLPRPNFFLNMSHVHTISSARSCLQVSNTDQLRTITLQYKRLARMYHPDKWHPNVGCTKSESVSIFQCISNAYTLLRRHKNN